MTFRDHVSAQRERFDALLRDITALRASVTDAFWRLLPREVSQELEALQRALESVAQVGTFHEQLAARERHRDLLSEWIDRIDELEREGATIPDHVHAPELFGALPHPVIDHVFGRVRRRADLFRRAVHAIDPHAHVHRQGSIATARLRVADDPFAISGALAESVRDGGPVFAMATGTSKLTAPLQVVRISTASRILVGTEPGEWHATGDERFDARYHVRGRADAIQVLLSHDVRDALLTLPSLPALSVEPGRAKLEWRGAPHADTFARAARTLAAIRHAPPLLRLKA